MGEDRGPGVGRSSAGLIVCVVAYESDGATWHRTGCERREYLRMGQWRGTGALSAPISSWRVCTCKHWAWDLQHVTAGPYYLHRQLHPRPPRPPPSQAVSKCMGCPCGRTMCMGRCMVRHYSTATNPAQAAQPAYAEPAYASPNCVSTDLVGRHQVRAGGKLNRLAF